MKRAFRVLWNVCLALCVIHTVNAEDAYVRLGQDRRSAVLGLQKMGTIEVKGRIVVSVPSDPSSPEIRLGFLNGRCEYINIDIGFTEAVEPMEIERLINIYANGIGLKRERVSKLAKIYGTAWVDDTGKWRAFLNDRKNGDPGIIGSIARAQQRAGLTLFSEDWLIANKPAE